MRYVCQISPWYTFVSSGFSAYFNVRHCRVIISNREGTLMLILTRRKGEELILTYQDVTIKVMVTDIHGKQAKIGIEAPSEVDVMREEILRSNGFE